MALKKTANDAENGVVDIQAGGKIDHAWGGYSINGIAKTNRASLSGGEAKSVIGGKSHNHADNNQVSISAGTVAYSVTGGDSRQNATNNRVTITGGQVQTKVYGGHAHGSIWSRAKDNQVSMSGGEVLQQIYGGRSYGEYSSNNRVSIDGGTAKSDVYGGYAERHANDNQVSISDGRIWGSVYGGYSYSLAHNAENNQITISGGRVDFISGGYSEEGVATNNHVSISGGTFSGGYVTGGSSEEGVATNNHVSISGGTFSGYINAGRGQETASTVTDNTLTIEGGTFKFNVELSGYDGQAATTGGNSMHLKIAGLNIRNIRRFNNLYFYLPNSVNNGDSVATLQASSTDLSAAAFGVCAAAGSPLTVGDTVTLIQAQNLSTSSDTPPNTTAGMTGCSPDYEFTLQKVNNALIATVTKAPGGINTYSIGGTVSGLSGTLILQNNGGDDLTLTADGGFTFATPVANGGSYAVSVFANPAGQNCSVNNASGTVNGANVNNVEVICNTNPPATYNIGGTVSGLNGTLVLQNNGGDNLTLMTNGGFTFATPVANGGSYAVSVLTQPAGQTCSVNNAGGTVNGGPVTNIAVTCQSTGVPQQGTAQPVPGLGGKALALLMLILAAMTAWFIHRRSATVL